MHPMRAHAIYAGRYLQAENNEQWRIKWNI